MSKVLLAFVFSAALFAVQPASAYVIESVRYNQSTQDLSVKVIYTGGCEEHSWEWAFDECATDETPNGLAVRLIDSGGNDTCDTEIHEVITRNMADLACPARPVNLSIFVGRAHHTLLIP